VLSLGVLFESLRASAFVRVIVRVRVWPKDRFSIKVSDWVMVIFSLRVSFRDWLRFSVIFRGRTRAKDWVGLGLG
jgi:hypothetical protein